MYQNWGWKGQQNKILMAMTNYQKWGWKVQQNTDDWDKL